MVAREAQFQALLRSEAAYFRRGAEAIPHPPATLFLMRGFESTPLGGVAMVGAGALGTRWLDEHVALLREHGVGQARLYFDPNEEPPRPPYVQRREEVGYVREALGSGEQADVSLVPIDDEGGWAKKLEIHQGSASPDGHAIGARTWVAFERRKAGAGGLESHLIEQDGRAVGAVGVIHEPRRRMGIGLEVLRRIRIMAGDRGHALVGCFGVDGSQGQTLYESGGWRRAGTQVEWTWDLAESRA